MLIDVHAHLDHCKLSSRLDEVIANAKKAGVKKIIANGLNPETNRKVLEISSKYDIVEAALGIYPIDALQNEVKSGEYPLAQNTFDVDEELEFIKKNKSKIIAIGEVGLDYLRTEEKEQQKQVFLKLIELSEEIKKPLIIHSRKAEEDVINLLESSRAKKVILHCFCGKKPLIKTASDLGYTFSIPTNIVRSQQFQELVKSVNINQLLPETDAPYLSPYQGQWNEPAFITEVYKKISEIKGFMQEEVEKALYSNFQRLF